MPQKILLGLLTALIILVLSPGIHFKFWNLNFEQENQKTDQNQTSFSDFEDLKRKIESITGKIIQMPNPKFIDSYMDSLSWTSTINIQTYELTEKNIKKHLKKLAEAGTQIRIMIENQKYQQYQNTFKQLQKEYADMPNIVIKSDQHMKTMYLHSKITLMDKSFWIQSSNLTHSTFAKNREHLFRSENPKILKNLTQLFEKDRSGKTLSRSDLHPNLVVCNINCREVITHLLSWAQHSIAIETQYLTDPQLFDILANQSEKLDLKMIFSNTESVSGLPSYFWNNKVRLMKKPYLHTKMILIDDEILLLGSMNLSANSLDNNREIWILINDPDLIWEFKKSFAQDWEKSNQL